VLATLPPELWILGVVLGLALVVGVPAIRYGVWLPRELEFEILPDHALTGAQLAHYQRLDVRLAASGYTPRFNFTVTNMQGATLSRVYLCDHDAAVLGAHCLRGHAAFDESTPGGQNYLEWITKYQDGATLTTRNAELSDLFDRMPHQVRQVCIGVVDPLALKARHDRKAAELLARGPLYAHGRDLLAEFQDFHRRFCAFQESRGLLVAGAGGRCHPTVKTALRGVWNYFDPLADNFTLPRFLLAVVLGAGLPALATWLTTPGAVHRPAGLPVLAVEPALRLATLGLVYAAAGAVVGWVFTGKAFIWAALLGYLPLRLLTPHPGAELLLAFEMGLVAEWTARMRIRRELLV
jgi:hypothetical protein